MMPLAFDLISTLVIGSTLPVATTDRTIVPRSTTATLDGSSVVDARLNVENPQPPTSSAAAPAPITVNFFAVFILRLASLAQDSLRSWRGFRLPARPDETPVLTNKPGQKLPTEPVCGF